MLEYRMDNSTNYEKIIAQKDAEIARLEALVKLYIEALRLSKSRSFAPKSEKKGLFQYTVFGDVEDTASEEQSEPVTETITYTRKKKRKGKRKDDLSRLPVEVIEHELPEGSTCPECGGSPHKIGHETIKNIKIIPAQIIVEEHRQAVYGCRNCEKNGDRVPIVKAPMPKPLIKNSLASPSAVAYIMHQKYVMCAPLYRLEKDFERLDAVLSRQTMSNWVIRCAEERLRPVYERLHELLVKLNMLHADESKIQVLNEPDRSATSDSFMWLYRTSGDTERHIILYNYQETRAGKHPKQFLEGFSGFLHVDGWGAYNTLQQVILICCWIHLRRKFVEAIKSIPAAERAGSVANEALVRIGWLFHLEGLWEGLTPEKRMEKRLKESKPKAEEFFSWLKTTNILPKTTTGKAIRYAFNQQEHLMNVYLDGRAELSNNRIENSVRPYALGRKNWLFCNTPNGAVASSIVYSIIETAKANGLKPFHYLEYLLSVEPGTMDINAILPWGDAVPERCHMKISLAKSA